MKYSYSDIAFNDIKIQINEDNWRDTIPAVVMYYKSMENSEGGQAVLRLTRAQYADMARGGDGGAAPRTIRPGTMVDMQYVSVRESCYPQAPTAFFQELCDLLGWPR